MSRIFIFMLFSCFPLFVSAGDEIVLLDATQKTFDQLIAQSSKLSLSPDGILVDTDTKEQWPGCRIERQKWNLQHCDQVLVKITNRGKEAIRLHCRIDSPEIDWSSMAGTYTESFSIPPGQTVEKSIRLASPVPPQLNDKLFAMRGYPGGTIGFGNIGNVKPFHKDDVVGIVLFLDQPGHETHWTIHRVAALRGQTPGKADWMSMSPEKFFPMIDKYGQFKYEDWPGKIHNDTELGKTIETEDRDLAAHPGPKNRSLYGGDAAGKKYNATGHFRVEKIDGIWWLIDPEGHLFWSHGADCVRFGHGDTPVSGREFYFTELPAKDDPAFRDCYGTSTWATSNPYYQKNNPFTIYNFSRANLIRKYGDDWRSKTLEMAHKRFKSWGMNTIGNWSDRPIFEARKTPYTDVFGSGGRSIEGSHGHWGKFPDPFSSEFEQHVSNSAKWHGEQSGKDPWCLGYFVDNELSWGSERSLALSSLASPADQPTKLVFVEDLKKKYGEIEKLNESWGTNHDDWNALIQSTTPPDEQRALADLDAFHKKVCDKYFRTIRDAIRREAPDKLYLGCRFAWSNETAVLSSTEYCDVVSFNKYTRDLNDFKLPKDIDMPVIIGEFHFGALDRGMFHTGLVPVNSQQDRAKAYETYVTSALKHPLIIGTHWFQYSSQATTGREDGENFQIGLVDICDTPYPETIKAVRKVGYRLYEIRGGAKQ